MDGRNGCLRAVEGSGADPAKQFVEAERTPLTRMSGAQAYDGKTRAEDCTVGFIGQKD
jgi:hypothetical protein